ncbi:MAG: nucleoside triphosphate pyrophosphatase [Erysipelothrix sp.]
MKLILASNSLTRKQILKSVNFKFEAVPSHIEEVSVKEDPREYCIDLSIQKAKAVENLIEDGIILSADSVITLNGKILEKPKNLTEARDMMEMLSGEKNTAITGVTLFDKSTSKIISFYEETEVYFKSLSSEEIDWYLQNEEHIFDRAGYSIAGKASLFISKINGDYNNILGLPMNRVYVELKELGFSIHDFI